MNALTTRREIFFIDARIEGYESILVGMGPAADTHILNQQTDGMSQILDALAQSDSRYDAVHLITHGSSAQIDLPGTLINADNLQQHKASLERIGGHLSADADFLVYGCNIGGDEAGRLFTQEFSKMLGVDVATSDDLTGAQPLGGDAVLEVRSGRIETPTIAKEIWNESAVLLVREKEPNYSVAKASGMGNLRAGGEVEGRGHVGGYITNDGPRYADIADYFKFTLSASASVEFDLSARDRDVAMRLWSSSSSSLSLLQADTRSDFSKELSKGTYYVRVGYDLSDWSNSFSDYQLTVTAPSAPTPPTPPRISSVSSPSAEEGNTLRFTVTLDRAPSETTTYYYATYRGTAQRNDYDGHLATPLVFRAGDRSETIRVQTREDTQDENDETFDFYITDSRSDHPSSGRPSNYLARATGTIRDDDDAPTPPPSLQSAEWGSTSATDGDSVSLTARFSNPLSSRDVVVFKVYEYDLGSPDDFIRNISASESGSRATASWVVDHQEGDPGAESEFYFKVFLNDQDVGSSGTASSSRLDVAPASAPVSAPPPSLQSAEWGSTSATDGDSVSLTARFSNPLSSRDVVVFKVYEDDLGSDDHVINISASESGSRATASWVADHQDDGFGGGNPEFYFEVFLNGVEVGRSGTGSSRLDVAPASAPVSAPPPSLQSAEWGSTSATDGDSVSLTARFSNPLSSRDVVVFKVYEDDLGSDDHVINISASESGSRATASWVADHQDDGFGGGNPEFYFEVFLNGVEVGDSGTGGSLLRVTPSSQPALSLQSAEWGSTSATDGDSVSLTARFSNPLSSRDVVVFKVYEYDLGSPDDFIRNISASESGSRATASWVVDHQEGDPGAESEFYFKVFLNDQDVGSSGTASSSRLDVAPASAPVSAPPPSLQSAEWGSTSATDGDSVSLTARFSNPLSSRDVVVFKVYEDDLGSDDHVINISASESGSRATASWVADHQDDGFGGGNPEFYFEVFLNGVEVGRSGTGSSRLDVAPASAPVSAPPPSLQSAEWGSTSATDGDSVSLTARFSNPLSSRDVVVFKVYEDDLGSDDHVINISASESGSRATASWVADHQDDGFGGGNPEFYFEVFLNGVEVGRSGTGSSRLDVAPASAPVSAPPPSLQSAEWGSTSATDGDSVSLTARFSNPLSSRDVVVFKVYEYDLGSPDDFIRNISASESGSRATASWVADHQEGDPGAESEFYFKVFLNDQDVGSSGTASSSRLDVAPASAPVSAPPPSLQSAEWGSTSATDGDSVSLTARFSNPLSSRDVVVFKVYEDDLGSDDHVINISASESGSRATASWVADHQDDGFGGGNPEFYFEVFLNGVEVGRSGTGSSRLDVAPASAPVSAPPPSLQSAEWGSTSATDGDSVSLTARFSNPLSSRDVVVFKVYEDDLGSDDHVINISASESGSRATASWVADHQDDGFGGGNPEFYFEVFLNGVEVGDSGTGGSLLRVTPSSQPALSLQSAEWGSTSATDGDSVSLTANFSNPLSSRDVVVFKVYEDDLGSDEHVINISASESGSSATASWVADHQEDGFGNPEFYFEVFLNGVEVGDSGTGGSLLRVTPSSQPALSLQSAEWGSTSATDGDSVSLTANFSNPLSSRDVVFKVYERGGDNLEEIATIDASDIGGSGATAFWTVSQRDSDANGESELYFEVWLDGVKVGSSGTGNPETLDVTLADDTNLYRSRLEFALDDIPLGHDFRDTWDKLYKQGGGPIPIPGDYRYDWDAGFLLELEGGVGSYDLRYGFDVLPDISISGTDVEFSTSDWGVTEALDLSFDGLSLKAEARLGAGFHLDKGDASLFDIDLWAKVDLFNLDPSLKLGEFGRIDVSLPDITGELQGNSQSSSRSSLPSLVAMGSDDILGLDIDLDAFAQLALKAAIVAASGPVAPAVVTVLALAPADVLEYEFGSHIKATLLDVSMRGEFDLVQEVQFNPEIRVDLYTPSGSLFQSKRLGDTFDLGSWGADDIKVEYTLGGSLAHRIGIQAEALLSIEYLKAKAEAGVFSFDANLGKDLEFPIAETKVLWLYEPDPSAITIGSQSYTYQLPSASSTPNPSSNGPPQISLQHFTVTEGTASVGSVIASDPEDDAISYSLLSGGDRALFDITSEGVISFRVAPDYEAPRDSNSDNIYEVTVQVQDNARQFASAPVRVSVNNDASDDPQLAISTLAIAVQEGEQVTLTRQMIDAQLPNQQTNNAAVFHVQEVKHGTFFLDGRFTTTFTRADIISRAVVFRHDGSEQAPTFKIAVSTLGRDPDSAAYQAAGITFTSINDAPRTRADYIQSAGGQVTIPVLENDIDPEGDSLEISRINGVSDGTATIGGDGRNIYYTPREGFVGNEEFTYEVRDDNEGISRGYVTVRVTGEPNTAPVAMDDSASTEVGRQVEILVLNNDADVNQDPLEITGVSEAAHGTVSIVNNAYLRYRPDADFTGTETLTYFISDSQGGGDTGRVSIQVNPVDEPPVNPPEPVSQNNAPVAIYDEFTIAEDIASVSLDVLENDYDVDDGDTLSLMGATANSGEVSVSANRILYTPLADYDGNVRITYQVSDGSSIAQGLALLRIRPVNDAPTLTGSSIREISALPGESLQLDSVADWFRDVDADISTYRIHTGALPSGLSLNPSTGKWTGSISPHQQTTQYAFTVRATDSAGTYADQAVQISARDALLLYLSGSTGSDVMVVGGSLEVVANGGAGADHYVIPPGMFGNIRIIDQFGNNTLAFDQGVGIASVQQDFSILTVTLTGGNTIKISRPEGYTYVLGSEAGLSLNEFMSRGNNEGFFVTDQVTVPTTLESPADALQIYLNGNPNPDAFTLGFNQEARANGGAGADVYRISRFQKGNVEIIDVFGDNLINFESGVQITGTVLNSGTARLTLSTGAVVTVRDATTQKYQAGDGSVMDYEGFKVWVADTGSVPTPELLRGTEADDELDGGEQAEILSGYAGNDFLNGGGGSDVLNGGLDDDTLTGGSGSDSFVYGISYSGREWNGRDGEDTILDFSIADNDKLKLLDAQGIVSSIAHLEQGYDAGQYRAFVEDANLMLISFANTRQPENSATGSNRLKITLAENIDTSLYDANTGQFNNFDAFIDALGGDDSILFA